MTIKNKKYTKELEEKLTMTIEEMLFFVESHGVIFKLIQIGYEQADSNEERMVSHDEAIRIYFERWEDIFISLHNLNDVSRELLGTFIRIKTAERWSEEFPKNKAAGDDSYSYTEQKNFD